MKAFLTSWKRKDSSSESRRNNYRSKRSSRLNRSSRIGGSDRHVQRVRRLNCLNHWNLLNKADEGGHFMLTRIQHAAIVSENFVREARFYEAVLGMKRSKPGSAEEEKAIRTNYAVSISDGYVGVTVIGRKPGYVPGLHHFGIDVDDVEEAIARIKKKYP